MEFSAVNSDGKFQLVDVFFLQVVFARFSEPRARAVSKSFSFNRWASKKKTGWLGAKNAPYGMPDLKNGTPMVGRKPFRRIVDGHQPNSRGLYTHYKDFPDHPKYRELTGNYFFQDFKV